MNISDTRPVIPREKLDELKNLLKEDDVEISDAAAVEIGHWLLTRAKAAPYRIPKTKKELWERMVSQEKHPHGRLEDEVF